jgi:ribose 5-phosphate isomerase B
VSTAQDTVRIAIGADDAGIVMRDAMIAHLTEHGYAVTDLSAAPSEDYPDVAERVARSVARGEHERAVLICGTGIGMAIAANKVAGVRAAPCHDLVTAEMSRRHNDANVLCLSADLLGEEMIERIVKLWLETPFEGGRHARRVDKIMKYEAKSKGK